MGTYLNPGNGNFRNRTSGLFVDKTILIDKLNSVINNPTFKYICVSRPRRFGKSVAGNMISAYYSKGADSRELFSRFKISGTDSFEKHLNKYNVIKIDLNALHAKWKVLSSDGYEDSFVAYVSKTVCAEFKNEFPDVSFGKYPILADYLQEVYMQKKETFVIVIDEYDVLVREQVPDKELESYRNFLVSIFKNSELDEAISLAYITGILPVMKDKIQSKLNIFQQYTMIDSGILPEFFGFTDKEVLDLCGRYGMSFQECKSWYDGYRMKSFEIYNPEAVIRSMTSGEFKSYWSGTSTYEVVSDKIKMNFAGTKEDVIAMLGGEKIDVSVEFYDNTMTGFRCKDDVFTFLIHLGYLAYDENERVCYIPNKEIHEEWARAIKNNADYEETNKIIGASKDLLARTIAGDEDAVARALDESHAHIASNRSYNSEYSLQSAIYLAYIYALNGYVIIKEMTAGKGFADITYIPFDKSKPAMIVELKHNKSAESAITQIREKKYFESLSNWSGDLLFVGINYDEKTKKHECKIERFVK